jgi:hypothetical protein
MDEKVNSSGAGSYRCPFHQSYSATSFSILGVFPGKLCILIYYNSVEPTHVAVAVAACNLTHRLSLHSLFNYCIV